MNTWKKAYKNIKVELRNSLFSKTALISPHYVLKSKILLEKYKENLAKFYRFEYKFIYIGFLVFQEKHLES